jgi:uncharacterized protein
MTTELAIFPLNAVLFPGGVLPLRVFEPRYMDMVRDCMKTHSRFGVCLIAQDSPTASEVMRKPGDAATPEAIGCTAEITQWDMPDLGVLHISTRGHERFRILSRRTESNGLIRAEVEMLAADPRAEVAPEYSACAQLLARIIAELEEQFDAAAKDGEPRKPFPFAEPYDLADAGWVANRLCEVLQVPNKAKQKLMELPDGNERLAIVNTYLHQRKVL